MASLGTLLAASSPSRLAFLAAENLVPRWYPFIMRQLFNVLRAIPELILALAVCPCLGLTPTAGVLALAIGSVGTLDKLNSDVIEGIDPGPVEAADAVGASRCSGCGGAVIPQALPEISSFANLQVRDQHAGVIGARRCSAREASAPCCTKASSSSSGASPVPRLAVTIAVTMVVDVISGWVRHRILAGPPRRPSDRRRGPWST